MDKHSLRSRWTDRWPLLANRNVTLGLDGFVDGIVKVVQMVGESGMPSYFQSIGDFGDYITARRDRNFAVELEAVATKIGGNMPITGNALAAFGLRPTCVGALGYPRIHPVFEMMEPACKLFSFANPGETKALEFGGAKILMGEMGDLNHVSWPALVERIGPDVLTTLFSQSDLIGLLNWSELKFANAIWQGIHDDILRPHSSTHRPWAFVDLADCSRTSPVAIREAMSLLKSFGAHWNVVLGLNRNEAQHLFETLSGYPESDIEKIGPGLYDQLAVHSVVIHHAAAAATWDVAGVHRCAVEPVHHPRISTGAGDHFNAGYMAGLLMALTPADCLALGHATSRCYMQSAQSPGLNDLLNALN